MLSNAKKTELRAYAEQRLAEGWNCYVASARDTLSLLSDSDEAARLREENERLREALERVMRQAESDLHASHAEICRLQGLDPQRHSWPEWSSPANTLRWFDTLRAEFALSHSETKGGEE
jgi:streptogramin lyase